MLEVRNLTKRYGSFTALDGINFSLDKGVYGILGPNGAGKTTLLNLITDNLKRTGGEILFDGEDILKLGAVYRKKLGYTPQMEGIYEDFTLGQFMRYIAALKGMKYKRALKKTEELLKLVSLKAVSYKKLGTFSGGMRQRALLAAAMLDDPELLILDEPTAGLDPEERIRLRNHIAEISKERIILMATHVVSDIECIAGKVILMKQGKLIRFASPSELMEEIEGKVGEFKGSFDEVRVLKDKLGRGEILRRKNGFVLRVTADDLPDGFERVNDISLEDVYVYHGAKDRDIIGCV